MGFSSHNGVQIHYSDSGTGTALVFLHGLGSHGEDWWLQQEHFSKLYRVITIDVRGHGRSDKPAGPYSVPQYAADVLSVLNHLQLEKAHVVGLSMGGMVAFQLALDAPERCASLMIVNSSPAVKYSSFREKSLLWQRLLVIHICGMHRLGKLIASHLFPRPEQHSLRSRFVEHMAQLPKQPYIWALKSFLGWDVSTHLSSLNLPVLILAADQDYTSVAEKAAYTSKIPGAQLVVIKDSRHATPMDQPEMFNRALEEFLSRVSASKVTM